MRDIMEMAREAGLQEHIVFSKALEAFAELVRADERNRTWTQEHWTEYERNIAAAEREACAEICKKHADVYAGLEQNSTTQSAWAACIDNRDAIRAKGQA